MSSRCLKSPPISPTRICGVSSVARMVNLSLEHGNSDGSCFAYVELGWFVIPRFGDYQAAFRFGKLGLDLVEKRGLERFRPGLSSASVTLSILGQGTCAAVSNCCGALSPQRRRPATSNMRSMPATVWSRFFSLSEIRLPTCSARPRTDSSSHARGNLVTSST